MRDAGHEGGGARPAGTAADASLAVPPPAGSPWQRLYAGAHRLRLGWYRDRARRLPRPVISIGNLHWGGGGKTPLVSAVAGHLRQRGAAVCILSRGYGSRGGRGGEVRLVSRGDGPLLAPAEAGDEPVLLAGELPGVAVVVGADRYLAGLEALARLRPAPDVFVLDDGFSHLGLHRDLDILAFPVADPFGGGRLWPGGRLREPLAAVARADAALLTGAPAGAGLAVLGAELAAALRPYGFTGPAFACPLRAGVAVLHTAGGSTVPLAAGTSVLLASAIARPESFAAAVRELDFAVMDEIRFRDHHAYPQASLDRIAAQAQASGAAAVLVTSKDRVKLLGRLAVPLAELPVAADPEPAFWSWLDEAAERLAAPGDRPADRPQTPRPGGGAPR
jgi:tetraacyldisaccharide 4'-kinase